jgi:thiamine biosynthesis lipoprotein
MSLILILLVSSAFSTRPIVVERAFFVMGTVLEFKVYCEGSKESCNNAVFDAYLEVKRLDDMFSNYKADSKLSEVNSLAGNGKIPIPPEFFELTERALFFSNLTGGAFDITVGGLIKLWRESQEKNTLPDTERIRRMVSRCVDFGKIKLYSDGNKNEIDIESPCISIDFGGIGKGYAIDRAVRILKKKGIKRGMINFGGEIYGIGSPPGEKGWIVGVRHPSKKNEVLTLIQVRDMAVSTSGDYERYFTIEGRRFSHIIDPRTGFPVDSVPSVTVLAESATDADALSTAISVMGKSEGIRVIKSFDRAGVMVVTSERNNLSIYKDDFFKSFEVPNPK